MIRTVLLLLSMSSVAFALPEDKHQSIEFSAGTIEWDQLSHQGEFKEKVCFTQGTTKLYADHGTAQGDEHNQFKEVILYGNSKEQAHFLTLPKQNDKEVNAYADKMVYLPQQKLIQLFGHVSVHQGRYHFSAPFLQYDLEKKKVISQATGKDKTTVIVDPEQS